MGDKSSQMYLGCPWGLAVQDPCSLADIKDDTAVTFQDFTPFCSSCPLRMKLI